MPTKNPYGKAKIRQSAEEKAQAALAARLGPEPSDPAERARWNIQRALATGRYALAIEYARQLDDLEDAW